MSNKYTSRIYVLLHNVKKYIVWNGTEWTNMDGTALG